MNEFMITVRLQYCMSIIGYAFNNNKLFYDVV